MTEDADEADPSAAAAPLPDEQQATEQLARLFNVIDVWQAAAQQRGVLSAQPGSPLAGDDQAANPYHVSHAAVQEIVGALDHLHALRMLVQTAKSLHTLAPFTLNRAAIECGAIAVWLLAPKSRDERIRRRLVLATQNARDIDGALKVMGEASSLSDDLDDIRRVARRRPSLDPNGIVGSPPGVERIIGEAGDAFEIGSEAAVTYWKACSGITHNRLWASLNLLDMEELGHVANVGNYRMTASFRNVLTATTLSVSFSNEARRLFALRSQR